ncbi:MAG: hypothetical protein ACRDOP_02605 [Gaiellaceae bacterium]
MGVAGVVRTGRLPGTGLVSSPEARHSRNLAARPQVAIVVFDSHAPVGSGQGVYISAVAGELTGVELDRGIEIFTRRSQA